MEARFPLHCHAARPHYSALNHEATSERIFRDVTWQLNDLLITVHPAHVCSAVAVNSGEAIQQLGPAHVMPITRRSAQHWKQVLETPHHHHHPHHTTHTHTHTHTAHHPPYSPNCRNPITEHLPDIGLARYM
jgi:hypothetical protein